MKTFFFFFFFHCGNALWWCEAEEKCVARECKQRGFSSCKVHGVGPRRRGCESFSLALESDTSRDAVNQ